MVENQKLRNILKIWKEKLCANGKFKVDIYFCKETTITAPNNCNNILLHTRANLCIQLEGMYVEN